MEEKDLQTIQTKKHVPMKRIIVTLLVIAGSLILYFGHGQRFESTEDAYVETHMVQVSPKVSGQIVQLYVDDNQQIKEGDLVAKIDATDYRVKQNELAAKYDLTLNKQKSARAEYDAVDSEIKLAKKNLDRYTALFNDGAASKQELDNAKINYDAARAKLTKAKENVISPDNSRVADAELRQLAAQKQQAALNVSYTNIYAPQSGSVASKAVEKGSYVQVGQPLFAIVPNKVWVVANFKESQLKGMTIGQDVELEVDAYPGKTFKGKIDSIQRVSGAKSSLFPPENAVGSFVKIVQRIPVKIVFTEKIDTSKYIIVPGMSVVPKVRVK